MWSVSVRKSGDVNETDEEKRMFTVLSWKASARCLTPSSPISLAERSSVVSVYERKAGMATRTIRIKRC